MLFGNRRPQNDNARRLTGWSYQPRAERLEPKILFTIDLGGTSPPSLPRSATAPYGINLGGATPSGGAGWSVADIADVTNSRGYDDILVGAPTVNGSGSALGSATGGAVYLIFGSASANSTTVTNWLNTSGGPNLAANDRVGDLAQLGATSQTNPISNTALNFPFSGITFTATGVDANSSFGASVAEVKTSSGYGIVIGAPNAPDANGANPGTGRVFLIQGNFSSMLGKTVDVDTPSTYGNLTVVTFVSSVNPGGEIGYSVAGGSNILGDGLGDLIIGAPQQTIGIPTNGVNPVANTGAVYVISAALLPSGSGTFNLATQVGQSGSQSVVFAGEASGDEAGWSVADAGNVNKNGSVDDLLIGAPDNLSEGAAYLVYGGSNLGNLASTNFSTRYISLALVGGTATGSVPGAKITGPSGGAMTGFSVSAGGDFNADGYGDILIGSPGGNAGSTTTPNSGEVDLIYGSASALTGTIALGNLPATVLGASFIGANSGDMAGYAVSQVGLINSGQPTSILIGAPGFNANSGTAYLIPGRAGLTGSYSLSTAQSTPLSALQFVNSTPTTATSSPPFFGASLSGRIQGTQQNTVDLDNEADFVIGAPGLDITQNSARTLAGAVQILESGFLTVPIPSANSITTQIGVGTPFAPFSINATTPANLQIYVFGTTTTNPAFTPVTDIDPTTVKVNGVAYPNATLAQDPNQANWLNGIPDAIITISPRSNLNLTSGATTFVVTGQTLGTSPLPNETWTGSTTVTVTGGSSTPVVSVGGGIATGPVLETEFVSVYGANQFVPSLAQLSALSYAPIPLSVAMQQFLPPAGFAARNYSYNHPGKHLGVQYTSRGQTNGSPKGFSTLNQHVFNRSRFHAQRTYNWTHKAPNGNKTVLKDVVPVQAKRNGFNDTLIH